MALLEPELSQTAFPSRMCRQLSARDWGPNILARASAILPQWQLGLGLSGTRVPMDPGRTAVIQNPGEDGVCHADGRQVPRHSLARGEVWDRKPQSVLAQENLS